MRTTVASVVTFSCGQEAFVERVKVVGVLDQFVVMIFTRRLSTTVFSHAAVFLVVQFAIDSLSHFDKHSSHQHQNLKRLVCGRESNDIVTHVLWCSLLSQRVGMRHPFPIVPRFVPCSNYRKKTYSCLWARASSCSTSQWASVFRRETGPREM